VAGHYQKEGEVAWLGISGICHGLGIRASDVGQTIRLRRVWEGAA
jgi:hypothetical protein